MSLVTFRPIGRLGNNLFQAAACIGYAKKYGMKWGIPERRSAGDLFEDKPTPWLLPQYWPKLPMCYSGGHRYEQHDVNMFNYKPIPHFPNGVTLVGFFQSEKWFENAKEEVKAAFPLKHYPEDEGYVSIHVRRGDYVTNSNSFPPIGRDYILMAISNVPWDGKPYFFSDDIEWCKQTFKDFPLAKFESGLNEFEALSHMASCSHHIIANSTFSWWGAWLGHNPDRIVVSPSSKNWFGPGFTGDEPTDLIPERWIQIKY